MWRRQLRLAAVSLSPVCCGRRHKDVGRCNRPSGDVKRPDNLERGCIGVDLGVSLAGSKPKGSRINPDADRLAQHGWVSLCADLHLEIAGYNRPAPYQHSHHALERQALFNRGKRDVEV